MVGDQGGGTRWETMEQIVIKLLLRKSGKQAGHGERWVAGGSLIPLEFPTGFSPPWEGLLFKLMESPAEIKRDDGERICIWKRFLGHEGGIAGRLSPISPPRPIWSSHRPCPTLLKLQ